LLEKKIVLHNFNFRCRLFPTVWIVVAKTVGIGVLLYDSWGCSITPVSIKFLFPVERLVSEPLGLWLWKYQYFSLTFRTSRHERHYFWFHKLRLLRLHV